nr:zinc finger and SCAN domain-containing protein 12-like [Rhipicephalus microplus]
MCDYATPYAYAIKNHQRTHTGERPYKCDQCDKAFRHKHHLVEHVRAHTGEKPFQCPICPMKFVRNGSLKVHIAYSREVGNFLTGGVASKLRQNCYCSVCFCVFRAFRSEIFILLFTKCRVDTQVKATAAQASCTSDSQLWVASAEGRDDFVFRVIGRQENGSSAGIDGISDMGGDFMRGAVEVQEPYAMVEVGTIQVWCANQNELVSVPLHHGQPDPPGPDGGLHLKRCLVSGYTTSFKQRMQCHQRIHTGERPHKRRYCSKAFKQTAHLTEHVHIHTGERPFQCHLCPMNFTRQSNLMRHLRTHTDERPYKCNQCNKAFRQLGHLNDHVRIHTGERPFECHLCPMNFSRKNRLVNHLATHRSKTS